MSPEAVLAIERVIERMHEIVDKEDTELSSMGVGWPSAHTEIYRFAKDILKDIHQIMGGNGNHATKKGVVSKDDK